jgi:hypothetical protein
MSWNHEKKTMILARYWRDLQPGHLVSFVGFPVFQPIDLFYFIS